MLIFLVLIALQLDFFISTNIETSVSVNQNGHYSLNVSRESQGIVSSIPGYIDFDTRYRIHSCEQYPTSDVLRFGVRENVCYVPFPESTCHANFRAGRLLIGLGVHPESHFIRFVGSAGIVRRSGETRLVVNITGEYWDNACLENSSLSFFGSTITGGLSFSLVTTEAYPVSWTNASYTTIFGSDQNDLIQAPGIIIDAIHGQLARLGAVEVLRVRSLFFRHCTNDIVHQLPDLVVSWPSIGSLLITSREYVHHYPSVNMCALRIGRLSDSSETVELSPLRFNDLNIRTTPNSITFCDPESLD